MESKKAYAAPELERLGSVAELTLGVKGDDDSGYKSGGDDGEED